MSDLLEFEDHVTKTSPMRPPRKMTTDITNPFDLAAKEIIETLVDEESPVKISGGSSDILDVISREHSRANDGGAGSNLRSESNLRIGLLNRNSAITTDSCLETAFLNYLSNNDTQTFKI